MPVLRVSKVLKVQNTVPLESHTGHNRGAFTVTRRTRAERNENVHLVTYPYNFIRFTTSRHNRLAANPDKVHGVLYSSCTNTSKSNYGSACLVAPITRPTDQHCILPTMSPIDLARLQALWVSRRRRLTLFGRSVVLVGCEVLANALCWIVAGILFARRKDTQQILSLALLAWVCLPFSSRVRESHNYELLFLPFQDDRTEAWCVDRAQVPLTKDLILRSPHRST
jgi:hypothetical protein